MRSNKIFDMWEGEYRVFFNFYKDGSRVTLGFPSKNSYLRDVYLKIDGVEQNSISIPEASGYLSSGMRDIIGSKVKGLGGGSKPTKYVESKSNAKPQISTYEETLSYLRMSYSIGKIARLKGVKEGTIINHVTKLSETNPSHLFNHLKPSSYIIQEVRSASRDVSTGPGYLKTIHDRLNGRYDYDSIRLSLVFV